MLYMTPLAEYSHIWPNTLLQTMLSHMKITILMFSMPYIYSWDLIHLGSKFNRDKTL